MSRATHSIPLKGGVNLVSPDDEILEGQLLHAVNIEQGKRGGYKRIDGYERFDGRELSTALHYCTFTLDTALPEQVPLYSKITVGGVTAITLTTVAAAGRILHVATSRNIVEGDAVVYYGTSLGTVTQLYEEGGYIASDGFNSPTLGSYLDIAADTLTVVGVAPYQGGADSGALYLVDYDADTSTWPTSESAKLEPSILSNNDHFGDGGVSISDDGNVLVAGCNWQNATYNGYASVFRRVEGAWVNEANLNGSLQAAVDNFGQSVAISGDGATIAVGAPLDDTPNGTETGAVYIFTYNSTTETWSEHSRIVGWNGYDDFGWDVSLNEDGTKVLIGAQSANPQATGRAYVYKLVSDAWELEQRLNAPDETAAGQYGKAVKMSSDGLTCALIDASLRECYVWNLINNVWVLTYTITQPLQWYDSGDQFSIKKPGLNADGSLIVLSAYNDDDVASNAGAAYLFAKDANAYTWSFASKFTASDGGSSDAFSTSVAVAGSSTEARIAVGATGWDDAETNRGKVYIYKYYPISCGGALDFKTVTILLEDPLLVSLSESDVVHIGDTIAYVAEGVSVGATSMTVYVFEQFAEDSELKLDGEVLGTVKAFRFADILQPTDLAASDAFGRVVKISEDQSTMLVTSENVSGKNGIVYVFRKDTDGDWSQITTLTASDGGANDYFGNDIDLSTDGSVIVVGAYAWDGAFSNTGAVYVYRENATNVWTEEAILEASDAYETNEYFGRAVAISGDGTRIVAGAPNHDNLALTDDGSAYVFDYASGAWTETQIITRTTVYSSELFGMDVAISSDGTKIAIGADQSQTYGTASGQVNVYTLVAGTWTLLQQIGPSDVAASMEFGEHIEFSYDGLELFIGERSTAGSTGGKMYAFSWNGTTFQEAQIIVPSSVSSAADFAYTFAVGPSGNSLVVGAPQDDLTGSSMGSVFYFTKDEFGLWQERTKITYYQPSNSDQLGFGVAVEEGDDETTATVYAGAIGFDDPLSGGGGVINFQFNQLVFSDIALDYAQELTEFILSEVVRSYVKPVPGSGLVGGIVMLQGEVLAFRDSYNNTYAEGFKANGDIGTENIQWLTAQTITASDQFGEAIAASYDADVMVVGFGTNDEAYIYKRDGGVYLLEQIVTGSDTVSGDAFGATVAVSGDGTTIAISATGEDGAGTNRGKVYIFRKVSGTWTEVDTAVAADAQDNDSFGSGGLAISEDGYYIVVGTPLEDGAGTDRGKVYILKESVAVNDWSAQNSLTASDAANSDYFGRSVAVSADGSVVAVGAYGDGSLAGSVYVYSGANWAIETKLTASNAGAGDWFGWRITLSLDATLLVVGAPYEDTAASNAGAVYVFKASSSDATWSEEHILTASNAAASALFGYGDIQINGDKDTLLIGSQYEKAYIFKQHQGYWHEEEILSSPRAQASSAYGLTCCLPPYGNLFFMGAWGMDFAAATDAGIVFVQRLNDGWECVTDKNFVEIQQIVPADVLANDFFGKSVAINKDGTHIVASAYADNELDVDSGKVRTYARYGDTWTDGDILYSGADIPRAAGFGTSLSLDDEANVLVVGAPTSFILDELEYKSELAPASHADGDRYGYSSAMTPDGEYIVVGSYTAPGGGTEYGTVTVFKRNFNTYSRVDTLVDASPENNERLGISVAISDDAKVIIAGASYKDNGTLDEGSVIVFRKDYGADTWTQEQELTASDSEGSAYFGGNIAISGDGGTIVVSSHLHNSGGGAGADRGQAYTFVYSSGTWSEQTILVASDAADFDYFGQSVAVTYDGSIVVVGAGGADSGAAEGAVYIFEKIGSDWYEEQIIEGAANDGIGGASLSITNDGELLVISATGAGSGAGRAYVYEYDGENYTSVATLEPADLNGGDGFGTSLDITNDGTYIIIGAIGNDKLGSNTGIAYLYKYDGSTWAEFNRYYSPEPQSGSFFGRSVRIQDDANRFIITDYQSSQGGTNRGMCYEFNNLIDTVGSADVFTRGINGWAHAQHISPPERYQFFYFGETVAISGDGLTIAIAASRHVVDELSNSGKVWIYNQDSNGNWGITTTLELDTPIANAYFGNSMAFSYDGKHLAIGAFGDENAAVVEGRVFYYSVVSGEWTKVQTITSPNGASLGYFGYEVDFDDDASILVVGAIGENTNAGRSYIYERSSTTFTHKQTLALDNLKSTEIASYTSFGKDVSSNEDGNLIAIAQGSTSSGESCVHVFERLNDYWTPIKNRLLPSNASSSRFGNSIGLDAKAQHLVVGTPGTSSAAGEVFVFDMTGMHLEAGGKYDFEVFNFYGSSFDTCLYGANGVNRAFEYTGATFKKIYTGLSDDLDKPRHVIEHKNHLFLSFISTVQHSSIGNPMEYEILTGAAEIGIRDTITGMIQGRGGDLTIFSRNRTFILYGSSTLDWELKKFSAPTGAIEWTIQPFNDPIYLDDRGIGNLAAVQEYGNFDRGVLSHFADDFLDLQILKATASMIVREKNQYRLFFDDGTGLILTFDANNLAGITMVKLNHPVACAASDEGTDGREQLYFGSSNGYVFRMDTGRSFDGQAFLSSFRTARNFIGKPTHNKQFFKTLLELKAPGYTKFNLTVDIDYSSTDIPQETVDTLDIVGNDGFWTAESLNIPYNNRLETDTYGLGRDISFVISSDSKIIYPWTVNRILVDYSMRRRIN